MTKAIDWEYRVRNLYIGYCDASEADLDAAAFWRQMALDEWLHAAILERAKDSLADDRLSEQLGAEGAEIVARVERALAEASAAEPRTVGAALAVANTVECSEVNSIFALYGIDAVQGEFRRELTLSMFDEHMSRLTAFGRKSNPSSRMLEQ
jgi:hypothetical protein